MIQPGVAHAHGWHAGRIGGFLHRSPGLRRHSTGNVIRAAVGVALQHLGKQRVLFHRRVGCQAHGRNRARIQRGRPEHALRKQRDVGTPSTLAGCHVEQFQKGTVAHHDLARQRVGLRQQALLVAQQTDLTGHTQIDNPRLQIVRMGCQDSVAQYPQPWVRLGGKFGSRTAPCLNGFRRHGSSTAAQ